MPKWHNPNHSETLIRSRWAIQWTSRVPLRLSMFRMLGAHARPRRKSIRLLNLLHADPNPLTACERFRRTIEYHEFCPIESEHPQSKQLLTAAALSFYGTRARCNLMTWKAKTELSELASNPVLLGTISTAGECASIERVGSSHREALCATTGRRPISPGAPTFSNSYVVFTVRHQGVVTTT